jgi:hypothetical protein
MPRLQVSANRRFLVTATGAPFFYLADTAWELIHVLSREDADRYLARRAAQRFTVIQTVVLSEFDGLATPNAYGHLPFRRDTQGHVDPDQPDVRPPAEGDYWSHVDYVVDRAAAHGLYVALLPTWGDKVCQLWGVGPDLFGPAYQQQGLAAAAARIARYGRFLGRRYADRSNLIWMLGGDRPADGHEPIWRALAAGLAAGSEEAGVREKPLMTFHPYGGQTSSALLHQEDWLGFNMIQSGHGSRFAANYETITGDYHRHPPKPTLDGEARYEDHPVNWDTRNGRFDAEDVRQAAYWAVFAGGAGHTYGHYSVFPFFAPTTPANRFTADARAYWTDALEAPGARQMAHLRALMESRPYLDRTPDQGLVLAGQGVGARHVRATRSADGSYAFVYLPSPTPVTLDLDRLSGREVAVWWYDPREGRALPDAAVPGGGPRQFIRPAEAHGADWVLVLDDAVRGFPPPGAARV